MNVNRLLGFALLAAALALPSASRLRAQAQRGVAALPPAWVAPPVAPYPAPQVVAVRAGRLFDPRSGTMLTKQVIVIRGDRIVDVGPSAAIPAGARTVDLSRVTVLHAWSANIVAGRFFWFLDLISRKRGSSTAGAVSPTIR